MGGQVLDLPEFKLYDQGKADGKAEGIREGARAGSLETLVSLVRDGIIDETEAVKRSGLTSEEFRKFLK